MSGWFRSASSSQETSVVTPKRGLDDRQQPADDQAGQHPHSEGYAEDDQSHRAVHRHIGGEMQKQGKQGGKRARVKAGGEKAVPPPHPSCEKHNQEADEDRRGQIDERIHRHTDQRAQQGDVNGAKKADAPPERDGKHQRREGMRQCQHQQSARPALPVAEFQHEHMAGELQQDRAENK